MPSLPNSVQPLTKRKACSALAAHFNRARSLRLRDLFAQTLGRRLGDDEPGFHAVKSN